MTSAISFGDENSSFQAGIINGPVNTTFNLPPERPETPPHPAAVIPFNRDADFVGRETILDQIQQKCAILGSWTALVGLGGVGKSQLAVEFAYRTRTRSPKMWVFWVYAANAARFEQSYRDIADYVKIFGRWDPKANIFKLVHDWLRDSKQQWTLMLDNVDDARFLLGGQDNGQGQPTGSQCASKPLREYLPQSQSGSILITTRSMEVALKLVEQHGIITVEPMNETHALALFEKKLRVHGESNDIAKLAMALDYMPLAVVQAAAYISHRAPRYSVRQYLEDFRKSDRKRAALLNYDEGQLRRDGQAKNSIIITWQISFSHIHQTRPSAADLLSLMSFFDRQGIPDALLRNRTKQGGTQRDQKERDNNDQDGAEEDNASQSSAGDDEFEKDLVALRNFSFISVNADGTTFEMHRLVQLAMRQWLQTNGKFKQWEQQFVRNLCVEFPTGEYENWERCQVLFAHVKSAAAQRPEEESLLPEWATLLYRAAWYAWKRGSIADAEYLSVKSLRARRKVFGQEHEDTLRSMAMVGIARHIQGRWKEAEELLVQAVETSKRVLGAEHPDTLMGITKLSATYISQGRGKEAEELLAQVIETSKKVRGAEHPDTLASIVNLAMAYGRQERWKEAEELLVQAMETGKRVSGNEHLETLTSMIALGLTYSEQERFKEAEELLVQAMETSKQMLGTEHPITLSNLGILGETYNRQGRWEEAEELLVQVIETSKKVLGVAHPITLGGMIALGLTYSEQERFKEAEELLVQAMETRKKVFGNEHLGTLTSMHYVAHIWKVQGRKDDAVLLMQECSRLRQHVLGAEHPYAVASLQDLEDWQSDKFKKKAKLRFKSWKQVFKKFSR